MSGEDGGDRWHDRTAAHVERLRGPGDAERRRSAFDVIDRAARRPNAVADHLDALFAVVEAEPPAARWAAATAIGNVADQSPGAVAPHAERLLGHVAADERIREPISTALGALVPERAFSVTPLLAAVERGDESAAEAVDVLSVVAVVRPSLLSPDRLEALADADDEGTVACAEYLLTLLSAGASDVSAPYRPDRSGFYELSRRLSRGLPTSRANQFLTDDIERRAIDAFLAAELEPCGYRGYDMAQTPTGTQLVVRVETRPSDSPGAPTAEALVDELESRFGLEAPQVEIETVR